MTTIRLHNTKSRRKEEFIPLDPKNVRMYVCGPTVYDRAHLGNARPVIVFDVLNRLLRHVYGADHVTYVRNFTDVDDKINATALARQKAGAAGSLEELIAQRSDETIGWYHDDMDALGALRPDLEPRATDFVGQMVAMIADLVAKGNAYEAEGHVLFAVESYSDYGALSGRSIDDMIAGARVEVAPYKRNPMDFVLWKPSSDVQPGWDSPWGRGRPGWHIECSAMSYELLGASFDIHGGGNDLQFPHHENEIAQSACAHPGAEFARYWVHNEMLQVEGKKMSKSLGNFFTVRDLLDLGGAGVVMRFVFLGTLYGKPLEWTEAKGAEAEATLRKW
ncbi:MAG: cysteine--tRNA ligase, partial [Octadecabacter sp.]